MIKSRIVGTEGFPEKGISQYNKEYVKIVRGESPNGYPAPAAKIEVANEMAKHHSTGNPPIGGFSKKLSKKQMSEDLSKGVDKPATDMSPGLKNKKKKGSGAGDDMPEKKYKSENVLYEKKLKSDNKYMDRWAKAREAKKKKGGKKPPSDRIDVGGGKSVARPKTQDEFMGTIGNMLKGKF